ncbi:MAG: pilus assembly protein PilM [Oscillospiraceae bacterium]|nr:pilus assembly protein PilM [Oscillospiraceae bacterium]
MQNNARKHKILEEQGDRIFALDIGTRTVVGIVGERNSDSEEFVLTEYVVEPHNKRAMIDGQIEDIKQVSKIVSKVKTALEEITGIKLTKVSIAAAGRALRTHKTRLDFDISEREYITADMVKSMEIETIQKAQKELDEQLKEKTVFYCVGYSVLHYQLDGYKMLNLEAHKGDSAAIELIATFLPSIVVDGLYSVMSMNGLEVAGMTLEPIAAMNVIVPPEIRAINIALVDIGAGTSDIAVSRDGSVVAYAMATTAGDEITEEIIKTFFVDFSTAEEMKINSTSGKKDFEYRDIFGITQKVTTKDFNEKIDAAVENLANAVCEHIQTANKASPAAVFLVGGGSLIGGLNKKVATKLGLDENRVAIGNHNTLRSVDTRGREVGAEFVTPVGIALTAILNRGYDFSVITLNDEKIRVFDTKKLSIFELLTLAGYKTTDIMGRSGRSLNFALNGKRRIIKGGSFTPAEVRVNGKTASLNTFVTQGDRVEFSPAVSGENAKITLSEACGYSELFNSADFDDSDSPDNNIVIRVNGELKSADYEICSFDRIEIAFEDEPNEQNASENENDETQTAEVYTDAKEEEYGKITITLNGGELTLEPTPDRSPHMFLELLNHADFDPDNPIKGYTLLLNDKEVSFSDPIKNGDVAVITMEQEKIPEEITMPEEVTEREEIPEQEKIAVNE